MPADAAPESLAVGVLGTGRMGSGMARSLARAGFRVLLYNRTRARCEPLAEELHATVCPTPADIAARSDVTISMVADGRAVEELYRGRGGLLEGVHSGMVVVDSSTVLPETILGLEREVRAAGAGILDAPVSGSVSLAETGGLTIMAGGTADDLAKAQPAFDAVARKTFHVGALGAGAAMKLAVNAIIFGLNESLAEALVLAERAGIAPEIAYDVFAASAIGAPYVGYKRAAFLEPDKTPAVFSIDLASKDLRLIESLAEAVGVRMAQAAVNLGLLEDAAESQGCDADFSAVASHLRRDGGPMAERSE